MKKEDIKLVGFICLNPHGHALEEGRTWPTGGRYNGYVAIPSEYKKLISYNEDWGEYNLPPVHGGCTAEWNTANLKEFLSDSGDIVVANPENVTEGSFWIVGFDTVHWGDTAAYWTKKRTTEETVLWMNAIAERIVETAKQIELRKINENMKEIQEINLNSFFDSLPKWNVEEETGYKPCTTFWQDFSIADVFVLNGMEPDAVQDTHNRSWPMVKDMALGVKGLTEYVMVLNWKSWSHARQENDALCKLYIDLYHETRNWARSNLKGEDLEYYLDTID